MVESLNRITRQSSGQIDLLQIHDDLKEVEIREAVEVLKRSFIERPAQQIILNFKNLQVLSQGTIELLRKLVGYFQSMDLPMVFIGASKLNPEDLSEISQGFPVMDDMEEAKAYFDVKNNSKTTVHSKRLNGMPIDPKLEKDVTLGQPDEKVHPELDAVIKTTESEQNILLPESLLEEALDDMKIELDEETNSKKMHFYDQIETLSAEKTSEEIEFNDPDGVVKGSTELYEEDLQNQWTI